MIRFLFMSLIIVFSYSPSKADNQGACGSAIQKLNDAKSNAEIMQKEIIERSNKLAHYFGVPGFSVPLSDSAFNFRNEYNRVCGLGSDWAADKAHWSSSFDKESMTYSATYTVPASIDPAKVEADMVNASDDIREHLNCVDLKEKKLLERNSQFSSHEKSFQTVGQKLSSREIKILSDGVRADIYGEFIYFAELELDGLNVKAKCK